MRGGDEGRRGEAEGGEAKGGVVSLTEGSGERGAESRGKGVAAPARQNTTLRRTLAPTASRAHRRGRRERTQHTHTRDTLHTTQTMGTAGESCEQTSLYGRRGREEGAVFSLDGGTRCVTLCSGSHTLVMGPPRPTRADSSAPLAALPSLFLSLLRPVLCGFRHVGALS